MNLLYLGFYVTAIALALPVSLFNRKLRRGLVKRIGVKDRLSAITSPHPVYWFQVASSGEFEQCLPILEELKTRGPVFTLVTYFSPSAEKAIELEKARREKSSQTIPWDLADYSPWDLPWVVNEITQKLRPTAYITIHREIWPSLLRSLKKHGAKTYLFSTFWPVRSTKRMKHVKRWLELFDWIGTVNAETATLLKRELPSAQIKEMGDSRIDRVLNRKKRAESTHEWGGFLTGNIFVGASLWSEDFEALKPCLKQTQKSNWRFVLVPHDPRAEVGEEIYEYFKSQSLPIRYWSSWIEDPDTTSHLIVNRVGFLAELYNIAKIVLVGGSFKGRIHNVLEPAAYGCPILTGPYVWNSNEATEMGQTDGLAICNSASELAKRFSQWREQEEDRRKAGISTQMYIEKNRGAGKRYADLLLKQN